MAQDSGINPSNAELMRKGIEAQDSGDYVTALDCYVRINELLIADDYLGISDDELDDIMERMDEVYPKVHAIMMKEIDANGFGSLVAGKHYFTHACCKAMRNLIDKDEVGLDFDEDICLIMDGQYSDDDEADEEEPFYTDTCPFCGAALELSDDFYD